MWLRNYSRGRVEEKFLKKKEEIDVIDFGGR